MPIANSFAGKPKEPSTPVDDSGEYETDIRLCKRTLQKMTVQLPTAGYTDAARDAEVRKKWQPEMTAKFGAEWANYDHASHAGSA